ncbi:hypothetical protein [Streptomyces thermogriseus]|uniref:Uncharacterized protein n=1 Tax=Streptomyces thermogriseus TaxID=75292 RepID=A0ABN1T1E9_9ACTN
MNNGGGLFWNEETQRWEDGKATVAPATPPPPGLPGRAPAPPGAVTDPDAPPSTAAPRPPAPPPGDAARTPAGRIPRPAPPGPRPPAAVPPVPPAPPTPPAPSAGTGSTGYSRRTVWTVVGASAAAGVAVALALSLGPGGDKDGDQRGTVAASGTPSPAESSPAPPVSEGSPVSEEPSAGPSSPPAGYVVHDDPEGFRIAVPDGWQEQRSTVSSQYGMDVVNYRDPTGHRRLQIFEVRESSPDASFDLFLSDAVPKPPGFQVVSRENLNSGDLTGSRLEYLADSLKGEPEIGTWHVVDQRFRAADGKIYAIASYGPDSDGRIDEYMVLATAVDWFCPLSAGCSS